MQIKETIPASRKLQAADAKELLKGASKLIVAKGKKTSEFSVGDKVSADAVVVVLSPVPVPRALTAPNVLTSALTVAIGVT